MLRLFSDCLDVSEATGDGWTVLRALLNFLNKEEVSISDISATWFLRLTAAEQIVSFGPKSCWDGLQHAVRPFLAHERKNQVLQQLLGFSYNGRTEKTFRPPQLTAFGFWLALLASQRKLLPTVVEAATFLRMDGFDWIDDAVTPRRDIRTLSQIYNWWTKTLPESLENIEMLLSEELEQLLETLAWTKESLSGLLLSVSTSNAFTAPYDNDGKRDLHCSGCGDDYTPIRAGLVSPTWIAFLECTKTNHKHFCACSSFLQSIGTSHRPDSKIKADIDEDEPNDYFFDVGEEFSYEQEEGDISALCTEIVSSYDPGCRAGDPDPFHNAATLLYRAQGRHWLGSHDFGETLCATCFLRREQFVGENMTQITCSPMPKWYGN